MSCIKRQMLHSVHIYLIILGGIMAMMIMRGGEGQNWATPDSIIYTRSLMCLSMLYLTQ